MRIEYKLWLVAQEYAPGTQNAQLHRVGRVEAIYGSLDEIYARGDYDTLIRELTYSVEDERRNKENPSKLKIEGNLKSNLQSYKDAVLRYRRYLTEGAVEEQATVIGGMAPQNATESQEAVKQKLSLERDMQMALRNNISQLEQGLRIIDDGAERSVASGFIDILCEDEMGATVVIELKAGKTDPRVVGQILGYMGDILEENGESPTRGIIVAHEFDRRTSSAARAVPNLKLVRYSISFSFEAENK